MSKKSFLFVFAMATLIHLNGVAGEPGRSSDQSLRLKSVSEGFERMRKEKSILAFSVKPADQAVVKAAEEKAVERVREVLAKESKRNIGKSGKVDDDLVYSRIASNWDGFFQVFVLEMARLDPKNMKIIFENPSLAQEFGDIERRKKASNYNGPSLFGMVIGEKPVQIKATEGRQVTLHECIASFRNYENDVAGVSGQKERAARIKELQALDQLKCAASLLSPAEMSVDSRAIMMSTSPRTSKGAEAAPADASKGAQGASGASQGR